MSSSDRQPYQTATVLDQDLLDDCADNLVCQLEMVCTIAVPSGAGFANDLLYLSDRNKYVGDDFYEARLKFPVIKRTVGELLSPSVEFSSIRLEVNNSDGKFNSILPGGAAYDSMIAREVIIQLGLSDKSATYKTIFQGFVSDIAGFGRTIKSFFIIARDKFDGLRTKFPNSTFSSTSYPNIQSSVNGKIIPYIFGDWTADPLPDGVEAAIPAFPVNGSSASVLLGNTNLQLVISENTNELFESTKVVLERSEEFFVFDVGDITNIGANLNSFDLKQSGTGGTTTISGSSFTFKESDKFWVKVKGQEVVAGNAYDSNAVEISRYILQNFGGSIAGDFDATFNTFRDKASPAASAIFNLKVRAHYQKQIPAIEAALSLLEQVRLEGHIDQNQKIKLNPLHFDEFDASPSFVVRDWDLERNSLKPQVDTRINVNRMKGFFNSNPFTKGNENETNFFKNSASITQNNKTINKGLVFPNMYIRSDVDLQVPEVLKITSSFFEIISVTQTWRSMLLDIGDFVTLDISIGSTLFTDVPCMIRSIAFSADGLRVIITYWSFQMIPFDGYAPTYNGIVGGSTATITEET